MFLLEKRQNVITISLKDNEQSQEEIRGYIKQIIHDAGKKGIGISELSNCVYSKYDNFNVKDFGYSQFSKFVQGWKCIRVKMTESVQRKKIKKIFILYYKN